MHCPPVTKQKARWSIKIRTKVVKEYVLKYSEVLEPKINISETSFNQGINFEGRVAICLCVSLQALVIKCLLCLFPKLECVVFQFEA